MNDKLVHEDLDLSLKIINEGGVIGYNKNLIVRASARRLINKPESFFVEYPLRIIKTFIENNK